MEKYTKKELYEIIKPYYKGISKLTKEELYNLFIKNYPKNSTKKLNKIQQSPKPTSLYFNLKKNIKLLLKLYNGDTIIHLDITNKSLIFLNNFLNKVLSTIISANTENPIYTYKVDDKILNKLEYSNIINKNIFIYLFELLYDLFEVCSVDSLYFENKEKGILGNRENVITPEIFLSQINFIEDKRYIS